MPERQYFSFKYAIPGYTFILLIVAINLFPLMELLRRTGISEVYGAFLAFLSLFAGAALGFLVSQFHWLWFKHKGKFFGVSFSSPVKQLIEKHLKDNYNVELSNKKNVNEILETVFDYISIHIEQEKTFEYSARRWDMYHTLASTLYALGMGSGIGAFFRVYFQIFLFKNFPSSTSSTAIAEVVFLLFAIALVIILSIVIWKGKQNVGIEYMAIAEAFMIRKLSLLKNQEKKEFKNVLSELSTLKKKSSQT